MICHQFIKFLMCHINHFWFSGRDSDCGSLYILSHCSFAITVASLCAILRCISVITKSTTTFVARAFSLYIAWETHSYICRESLPPRCWPQDNARCPKACAPLRLSDSRVDSCCLVIIIVWKFECVVLLFFISRGTIFCIRARGWIGLGGGGGVACGGNGQWLVRVAGSCLQRYCSDFERCV